MCPCGLFQFELSDYNSCSSKHRGLPTLERRSYQLSKVFAQFFFPTSSSFLLLFFSSLPLLRCFLFSGCVFRTFGDRLANIGKVADRLIPNKTLRFSPVSSRASAGCIVFCTVQFTIDRREPCPPLSIDWARLSIPTGGRD